MPNNFEEATLAILASIYLGIGLGFLNVVMCGLFGNFALLFFILVMIFALIFSGVYIPIWLIPEPTRSYMQYNPLLNLVEWMRSAYYASYDTQTIHKGLVIGTATVSLFLGLLGERFLRGKFFA